MAPSIAFISLSLSLPPLSLPLPLSLSPSPSLSHSHTNTQTLSTQCCLFLCLICIFSINMFREASTGLKIEGTDRADELKKVRFYFKFSSFFYFLLLSMLISCTGQVFFSFSFPFFVGSYKFSWVFALIFRV